ncbi:MAG TPA: cytochrome c biogenesis CcdA family protein [bacterium]|mgnify:CR=1 FL=1|nr:cytochrome c biogenesis CcdA family protein [bacterium]
MAELIGNINVSWYAWVGVSFLAGIISFFSPCVLPLIPAYFSFILGSSVYEPEKSKGHLIRSVILMCCGFTIVFVTLGASATGIGRFLASHMSFFKLLAGIIMLVFALETLELTHIFSFHKGFSPEFRKKPVGLNAIIFGVVLGISWTPCVGPILGAILTMAATQETVAKGILLLFVYSLGLSVPLIIFAVFFSQMKKFQKFMIVHARKIRIVAGSVLLLFAFYLLSRGRVWM